jgi:hypothetical protein
VRAAVFLLALLPLTGCSIGGDAKKIDEARLDDLVLQRGDVTPGLRPVYVRNLDGEPLLTVRYGRAGTALSIESTVQVLESAQAADDRLEASRDALGRKPDWDPIDEPGLGDESFAATLGQAGLRFYEVFWRDANASASVRVEGFEGRIALADVLELARKQERRISDAAD